MAFFPSLLNRKPKCCIFGQKQKYHIDYRLYLVQKLTHFQRVNFWILPIFWSQIIPRKKNSLLIWTFDQKRIFLVLSVQMKVAVCGREQMLKLFLRKWCPTVWRSMIPSSPLNGPPSGGRPAVWIGGLGPPLGWPPIMWGPKPASLPPGNGGIFLLLSRSQFWSRCPRKIQKYPRI